MAKLRNKHTCLSCGCPIEDSDHEEQVTSGYPLRYRHKDWQLCQKALAAAPARDFQEYESRRDTTGVVFPTPTLGELDDAL